MKVIIMITGNLRYNITKYGHHLMMICMIPMFCGGCLKIPQLRDDVDASDQEISQDVPPSDLGSVDLSSVDQSQVDQHLDQDIELDASSGPCDEQTPPPRCGDVSTSPLEGVCAEALAKCQNGQWNCDFSHLSTEGIYSDLIDNIEVCDCYDNDCDGEVDEELDGCNPPISHWTLEGGAPGRHCYYRTNEVVELYPEANKVYELSGLTLENRAQVFIRKSEDEVINRYPGYLPDHSQYVSDQLDECLKRSIGGSLRFRAKEITLGQGSLLSADSIADVDCTLESVNGPSGGNLFLTAKTITLNGTVSANGSPPRQSSSVIDLIRVSGGAAGSVYLVAPNLEINGSVSAMGGEGLCLGDNDTVMNCGSGAGSRSNYAGRGPGLGGGISYEDPMVMGGGDSRDLSDIGISRYLVLLGQVESHTNEKITPADGNKRCDGTFIRSAGTSELDVDCNSRGSNPSLFNVLYEDTSYPYTFLILDVNGIPIVNDNLNVDLLRRGGVTTTMDQVMRVGGAYLDLPQEGGVYIVNIKGPNLEAVKTLYIIYRDSTAASKEIDFKTIVTNQTEIIQTTEEFNLPASNDPPTSSKILNHE
jgi:hypothetical protein